ncbi:barstar family protein [Algoriphagus sp. H41]|uniref:Barstar family protein n=1 Tax=Algoriphagus oliviformis TaxID=2811231 RepID=A0ABS3C7K8_9BACT|nr:barstar family protein [Algoriphagus oliviformis]MBN7813003.1 barstar family protein [Algoriphagus oliviformis]
MDYPTKQSKMGVFKRKGRTDPTGLDWHILQNGWTSLYFRTNVLDDDLKWFESENYVTINFDCRTWNDETVMHSLFKDKFAFPDHYGENFNALRDSLSDLSIIKTGLVVSFRHMDSIKKQTAHAVLDIFADASRRHMLFGNRLITLAQVDDPYFEIEPVGQTKVIWNGQEWFNSRRIEE